MILYVTRSNADLTLSNFIQTNQMCQSFSKHSKITCLVKNKLYNTNKYDIISFRLKKLYILSCLFFYLKKRQQITFVYSRYFHFSFLISLLGFRQQIFEVHHNYYKSGLNKLMFRLILKKSRYGCVVISETLKNDLLKTFPYANNIIHVLHDAHHNLEVNYKDNEVSGKFKVGYFGKVIPIKGSDFLEKLLIAMPDVDFFIYSQKMDRLLDYPNVKIYNKVQHSRILDEMYKMNTFLLTIEKIGTKHDFSSFTSPLKLFEYLSCGRPILCSDFPSLREFINSPIILIENNVKKWVDVIYHLRQNHNDLQRISKESFEFSKNFTWDIRVKNIYQIINDSYI